MSVASAGRPKRERERRKTARRRSRATPHKAFFEHSARSERQARRSRRLLGRAPNEASPQTDECRRGTSLTHSSSSRPDVGPRGLRPRRSLREQAAERF
jgi:hypothetical protein